MIKYCGLKGKNTDSVRPPVNLGEVEKPGEVVMVER